MKTTKMTNPEGKTFDIVADGVDALIALGWEKLDGPGEGTPRRTVSK